MLPLVTIFANVLPALVGGNHLSFYRQWAAAGMNERIPMISTTFGVGNEHTLISAEEGNGLIASYSYFEAVDNPANVEIHRTTTAREIVDDFPDGLDVLSAQGLVPSSDGATRDFLEQSYADDLARDTPD